MFLLTILAACACVLVTALSQKWAMGPLYRFAAARPKGKMQFNISDFLCLFVELQLLLCVYVMARGPRRIPTTGVEMFSDRGPNGVIFALLSIVLAFVVWWAPIRTLNRAGIFGTWTRSLVIVIVAPLCLIASIVLGFASLAFLSAFFDFVVLAGPGGGELLAFLLAAMTAFVTLAGLRNRVGSRKTQ